MATKISTTDLRNYDTTFEDIAVGSMFTEPECTTPYIKMPIFQIVVPASIDEVVSAEQEEYNAITLDGEPYWYDDSDEVTPIDNIAITIR